MPEQKPFMSVKIGTDSDDTIFCDIEAVEEWYSKEKELWTWPEIIEPLKHENANFRHVYDTLTKPLRNIKDEIEVFKQNPTPNQPDNSEQKRGALENAIREAYKPDSGKLLHSSDPRA